MGPATVQSRKPRGRFGWWQPKTGNWSNVVGERNAVLSPHLYQLVPEADLEDSAAWIAFFSVLFFLAIVLAVLSLGGY